jgi:hypothetical protein
MQFDGGPRKRRFQRALCAENAQQGLGVVSKKLPLTGAECVWHILLSTCDLP